MFSVPCMEQPGVLSSWSELLYGSAVGDTDRDADGATNWARYVRKAVEACDGNVSRLARRAEIGRSSVYRYLRDDGTKVTIGTATRIALAINDEPANAIKAAGDLLDIGDELDPADPALKRINEGPFDAGMKELMIHQLRVKRAELREIQIKQEIDEIERAEQIWRKSGSA